MRNADPDRRSLKSLVAEFAHLRRSTFDLLASFDKADWGRTGVSSGIPLSVRAIGYILVGHVRHHEEILEERYLRTIERQ